MTIIDTDTPTADNGSPLTVHRVICTPVSGGAGSDERLVDK